MLPSRHELLVISASTFHQRRCYTTIIMGSTATESSSTPAYTTLSQPIKGSPPPVIVFFSFLDPGSYDWATKKTVASHIRKCLPAGTEVHRYHVSSTDKSGWDFGSELTRAWAVAEHLRVDDKMIGPLFERVFKEKTVIDFEGIREVFWRDGGIDKLLFDRTWTDATVVAAAKYQDALTRDLPRGKLPCILVNGRTVIGGDEIQHMCDDDDFGPKVGQLVRNLLDRH